MKRIYASTWMFIGVTAVAVAYLVESIVPGLTVLPRTSGDWSQVLGGIIGALGAAAAVILTFRETDKRNRALQSLETEQLKSAVASELRLLALDIIAMRFAWRRAAAFNRPFTILEAVVNVPAVGRVYKSMLPLLYRLDKDGVRWLVNCQTVLEQMNKRKKLFPGMPGAAPHLLAPFVVRSTSDQMHGIAIAAARALNAFQIYDTDCCGMEMRPGAVSLQDALLNPDFDPSPYVADVVRGGRVNWQG